METQQQDDGYWVTVFGFPKRLKRKVLKKMRQYGKITDRKMAARRKSNWFYVRYTCMHDAEKAAKYQHGGRLTSTVMIGVKLRGVRGCGHFSADQMDCKPTCQLLPKTQQLCNNLENADKFANNHTNVKEEMERCDDSKCDHVCQPVNTCDGNAENETSAIITSVQSEENVKGVTDIGGRSSNMEESDEDLKMTVEVGEVFYLKRGNWFSEVGEHEGAGSPDHEICNGDLEEQNDALQGKLQGLQELREDSSFGAMTGNENKEEKDGGISETKTRELSRKDKKSEKHPSNLCEDNLLGRKSSDSNPSSVERSPSHNNKKKARHQCEVCGYSTNKKSNLTDHMRVHTQEKPYVCDICNKGFTQKGNLQSHKRLHSGDKEFQCDICNKRFARKGDLQVHKRLHSGDKEFQCDICNKSFKRKDHLQRHKRLHSGVKQFQCDICGRRFSTNSHLNAHMITHTGMKSFKCKTCGVDFTYKSGYQHYHKKTRHDKDTPVFTCNFCKYSSKEKGHTKSHEIRNHTKNYPHRCNVCDMGFLRPGELEKHMISKHNKNNIENKM